MSENTTIKIPALMYHEVSRESQKLYSYNMTPMYDISEALFENQMKALADEGYRSIFPKDIPGLPPDGRYVIITFDDGLIGNAKYALPILKRYGFSAIFFVTVGSISKPRFMDWIDLRYLIDSGMSVQSHTMTHPSLQTIDESGIIYELRESKRCLERGLGTVVNSISFPHSSFDKNIIRLAEMEGYEHMFTSEMTLNHSSSFLSKPVVLGRITVTNKLSLTRYLRLVKYDRQEIIKDKLSKGSKNLVKHVIGIKNYGRLYRAFFNIKTTE